MFFMETDEDVSHMAHMMLPREMKFVFAVAQRRKHESALFREAEL